MRHWKALLLLLVASFVAGLIGSQFMPGEWYAALAKPAFNPPNWIFGPVWTALYILIALAAWRVWHEGRWSVAIAFWLVQLVFNAAWSWLFFGLHRIDLALADIVLLLALIIATMILFFRRDNLGGWLMVPYLAWVSFATVLTFSIWRLNTGA